MTQSISVSLPLDEWRLNLRKDGGRRVMYGGDPYEDDLEADGPLLFEASDTGMMGSGSEGA